MTNYYKENKYIKENFERKYFSTSLRHGYADAGDVVWQKEVGYRDGSTSFSTNCSFAYIFGI